MQSNANLGTFSRQNTLHFWQCFSGGNGNVSSITLVLSNHWCDFHSESCIEWFNTQGLNTTIGMKISPVVAENYV
jgi:hypothetical protein